MPARIAAGKSTAVIRALFIMPLNFVIVRLLFSLSVVFLALGYKAI